VPGQQRQSARQLLERRKRAADRLRREVMGADGSLAHPYFRSFTHQLKSFDQPSSRGDLVAAAALADLVYVGDFHATPSCQRFAAELLELLAARVPHLALCVEFVYTRQQSLLDRRQAGEIADDAFLKRLHYREEWGYPWEGYRDLLDRARDLGVPVHALDVPPRRGFSGLARRDDHAAKRIAALLSESSDTRLVVLFGESHLARSHLPRRVKARLKRDGLERREVVVFQNPDRIYWQLLARGPSIPETVRVEPFTYAIFHANPLEKYEAYRQILERWREDVPQEEEIDLTPAVHHLIGVLLGWLGIRADQRRLRHRAGWSEELNDAFPEVYSGAEAAELLEPILREHGRSRQELSEARRLLERRGALYESRSNTIFLLRYLPGAAAGAAARFLRAALTGRLFVKPDDFANDPAAAAYGAAYGEALAYVGSKLIDPTSDELGPADPPFPEHLDFERSRRLLPPHDFLQKLRRSRPLRRRLARDLGRRLGIALYDRVRRGSLDQRALRKLFTRPLEPDRTARFVLQLLREN
jgi:hypothetical protein